MFSIFGDRQQIIVVKWEKVRTVGEDMEVIDATGLVVAPGFIDTHSHSDLQILVDPEVRPKIMQGITTEVLVSGRTDMR